MGEQGRDFLTAARASPKKTQQFKADYFAAASSIGSELQPAEKIWRETQPAEARCGGIVPHRLVEVYRLPVIDRTALHRFLAAGHSFD